MIDVIDHGRIRELRLNRPPANAFNPALVAELSRRVTGAPLEGAEAIVVSGAPGLFTGGLDVPELLTLGRDEMRAFFRSFYGLLREVAVSEIPIAAALTGHSPAAGAVLAVVCDHRVMAEGRYKIGMNEVQVGLAVPPMLQYAMKRLVGPRQGDALLIAGALVSPEEALRIGLVDAVVPGDQVVPSAIRWAEGLLALPRQAMHDTRRSARADLAAQFRDVSDASHDEAAARWFGEETRATMRALVERLGKKG